MSDTPLPTSKELDAELNHILDVLCDDPSLLSTPEERGIAAVGYHNIGEAKERLARCIAAAQLEARIDELKMVNPMASHKLAMCADARIAKLEAELQQRVPEGEQPAQQ